MAKRGGHGGGHGGAWKVAYADFVTSMMSLFLVLWLVGSDDETKAAVQRYFKGELEQQGKQGTKDYTSFKPHITEASDKASMELVTVQEFKRAMERLRDQLKNSSEMGEDAIRFEFTADGMRITAIDRTKKPFFKPGTADLTDFGKLILQTISIFLERYSFTIEVEGHTQKGVENPSLIENASLPQQGWNLSTARAVTAQKEMLEGGINSDNFWRVAGYADRQPMPNTNPASEENRRISIIVRPQPDDNIQELREKMSSP